jgi:hypothetical protein
MAGSGIYCDNNKKVIDHVARQATKKTKKAKSHHHDDDVISQIDVSTNRIKEKKISNWLT